MKFDYFDNNININHQISHHGVYRHKISPNKLRKTFKFKEIHNKVTMFCLILFELLIILLIVGYYISPLNQITSVSVTGNHTIKPQSIVSDMRIQPGNSVSSLIHHRSHFEKFTFSQNAQLKSISVGVHDWNHVNVKIKEYPIIAYLNHDHRYFVVTNNGRRSHQSTVPDKMNPIIFNFKSGQILKKFVKNYRLVPDSVKPDINKIYYVPTKIDPNRIRVDMNDGNLIYANFRTWNRKIKYYPAISKSMKQSGIINLEFGAYSRTFKESNRK